MVGEAVLAVDGGEGVEDGVFGIGCEFEFEAEGIDFAVGDGFEEVGAFEGFVVGGELLLFGGEEGEDGVGDVRAVGGFELEVAGISFADGGVGEVIDHAVALGAVVSGECGFLIRGEVEFAAQTVHFFIELGGGGFFGVFASGFEGGETVFRGEPLEERDGGGGG